ncbi:hypothetical protein [Nocardioides sp. B-3]|uniref:hypothetical protein n=1 Tax=Nocardioides sp. B-3 TaxID=2895565 RepID=UPI002152AA5F|nr:hypothetical protein [Nocardioides sp. B-3]UUZ58488.1 hypothetical protein LP418_20265 [Nocardioides sp. B-3]
MASTPTAAQVLGRIILVTGKEEFLSERTVVGVRTAVKGFDSDAEIADSDAAGLTPGEPGRDGRTVPVLLDPVRDHPGSGGAARRLLRRHPRLRRGARGRHRAGARARRRSQGQRAPHQAAQARLGHRGEVAGDQGLRPDELRHLRVRRARRQDRLRRGLLPRSQPSAATCARSPPPPTS